MNVAGLRSWLYVEGGNEAALARAGASGADVLIQELEDFTPPARRAHARTLSGGVLAGWRAAGKVAAVRVNPLHGDGLDDLEGIMPARPDVVMLPKVSAPEHVRELDAAVSRLERAHGIEAGRTALVPNVENAAGLMRTHDIVLASPRVVGAVVASEDMAADLGAERGPDAVELDYVRARFHVECTAAGVLSIDCPYTWSDAEGCERDTRKARRLGYRAKTTVIIEHAAVINRVLTPSPEDVARARRLVAAFEAARERGEGRVELDGSLVELPIYLNAVRLLARSKVLS